MLLDLADHVDAARHERALPEREFVVGSPMQAEAGHSEGESEFDGKNGKAFAAEIAVTAEETRQQEHHAHHCRHRENVTEKKRREFAGTPRPPPSPQRKRN